jgi:ribosome-binding factor A
MPKRRRERVTKEILHNVSLLLHDKVKDPRLSDVTVVDVEVSPDLRSATVYFTVLGGPEALESSLAGLQSATPFFRRELARALQMRFAPELRFAYDASWEQASRIDQLLDQLKKDVES